MEKKKIEPISIITAVTFGIMVLLNILANVLPINGQNTGEVSDSYANLFAPAGYTFSIWGLIYVLLALYTFYQLGFFRKDYIVNRSGLFHTIGVLFSISSIANSVWILAWHYEKILLSTILIIIILICLMMINLRIREEELSLKEKIFIQLPFSVYFGWLTIATIANITTLLVSMGWNGFGLSQGIWMIIILFVGLIISGIIIIRERNIAYGLIIIWSYVGIYMKHISTNGWNNEYPLVVATVTICIVLLILTVVYTLFRKFKERKHIYK